MYVWLAGWLAGCMRSTCMYIVHVHTRSSSSACELLCSHQLYSNWANSIPHSERDSLLLQCPRVIVSVRQTKKKRKKKYYEVGGAQRRPGISCRWRQAMEILRYTRAKRFKESAIAYLGLRAYAAPNKVLTNQQMASYGANRFRLESKWRVASLDAGSGFFSHHNWFNHIQSPFHSTINYCSQFSISSR